MAVSEFFGSGINILQYLEVEVAKFISQIPISGIILYGIDSAARSNDLDIPDMIYLQ